MQRSIDLLRTDIEERAGCSVLRAQRVGLIDRVRLEDVLHEGLHGLRVGGFRLRETRLNVGAMGLNQGEREACGQRHESDCARRCRDPVAGDDFSQPISKRIRASEYGMTGQKTIDVLAERVRGRVALTRLLLEWLEHNRVDVTAEYLAQPVRSCGAPLRVLQADVLARRRWVAVQNCQLVCTR